LLPNYIGSNKLFKAHCLNLHEGIFYILKLKYYSFTSIHFYVLYQLNKFSICVQIIHQMYSNYVTFDGHFVKVSNMWHLGPIQLIGPTCPKDQNFKKSLKIKYLTKYV